LPVLVDDEARSVLNAFGLSAYPFTVVVDADGRVAGRATGALPIEGLIEFTESLG
jgi:hypothetical protein